MEREAEVARRRTSFVNLITGNNQDKKYQCDKHIPDRVLMAGRRRLEMVNGRHPTDEIICEQHQHVWNPEIATPSSSSNDQPLLLGRGNKRGLNDKTDSPAKKSRENFQTLLQHWENLDSENFHTQSEKLQVDLKVTEVMGERK